MGVLGAQRGGLGQHTVAISDQVRKARRPPTAAKATLIRGRFGDCGTFTGLLLRFGVGDKPLPWEIVTPIALTEKKLAIVGVLFLLAFRSYAYQALDRVWESLWCKG